MVNLPPEDSSDDLSTLMAIELNKETLALCNHGVYTDVVQAIECLNHAVDLDPVYSPAYNNLGMAYRRKGDHDKAIEYYEKALEIDLEKLGPEHTEVAIRYNNLGVAYQSKGDCDRAIEYYEMALRIALERLGKNDPHTRMFQENLDSLSQR